MILRVRLRSCEGTNEDRISVFNELLATARVDDGRMLKPLSESARPQHNPDHVRGMNYSNLGGSAGGKLYETAADVIRAVRESATKEQ